MNPKLRFLVPALALMLVLLATSGITYAGPNTPGGTIDPQVLTELAAKGQTNIFVKMASDASLAAADGIDDRGQARQYVYDTLTRQAESSQAALRALLAGRGFKFQPFWINNSIYVYKADLALVRAIAARGDVAYVRADHQVPLIGPVGAPVVANAPNTVEWGVAKINADDVWSQFSDRGEGIVVGSVDTGVRYTHTALNAQYRGTVTGSNDYNWWDPDKADPVPTDHYGHGTHTMGTMVGDDGGTNQIGVAPKAQWIAAQGCESNSCSDFDLESSAQWIACPTKVDGSAPDCSKAPDVVNNSWGGGSGDPWYQSYVDAWIAARILPVFSIGNSGPNCNTANSPGDYKNVAGIGATDSSDKLAYFSSKGPGIFVQQKPNLVAPGVNVRSAYNTSDTAYTLMSGTSMAAPHMTGTVALMLSHKPTARPMEIAKALAKTAFRGLPDPGTPNTCGGIMYNVYPNYIYGYGRVDALAAVSALVP